jgi:putative glycosyltransferase (TIGR04372 family)
MVPPIFGVPVVMTNFAPISHPPYGPQDLGIPKLIWHRGENRYLSFAEMVRYTMRAPPYDRPEEVALTSYQQNDSEDIRAVAVEMMDWLANGHWAGDEEDFDRAKRFEAVYPTQYFCSGFRSKLGRAFLHRHSSLLG